MSVVARVRRALGLGGLGAALVVTDVVAVLLAALVARVPLASALLATIGALGVARAADLHRPRLVLSIVDDLPGLLVAAAASTLVVVAGGDGSLTFALLGLAGLVLGHTVVHAVAHLLRRAGRSSRRVLVVGTGRTGRRLGATLLARPELGLEPVGCVATGAQADLAQARGLPLPLLGPVSALPRAMSEVRVDAVVVALPGPASAAATAAVAGLLASDAEVYAVPAHFPAVGAHARHPRELVDGVPLVHLYARGTWLPVRAVKRAVEVVVAVVALAALSVPLVVLGLLVLVETRGLLVPGQRRFRTRRVRSIGRPGAVVPITGRLGPVGLLLRRTRLETLPEVAWTLLRRVRHAGGGPGRTRGALTASALADEAQVDAGQLTR